MLRVCQQLALTVQYLDRNLLLLVTSASDFPLRRICSIVFGLPLTSSLSVVNTVRSAASSVTGDQQTPPLTSVPAMSVNSVLLHNSFELDDRLQHQPFFYSFLAFSIFLTLFFTSGARQGCLLSHAFLSLVVAKLSDLKNSPVFGPPCTISGSIERKFGLSEITLASLPTAQDEPYCRGAEKKLCLYMTYYVNC